MKIPILAPAPVDFGAWRELPFDRVEVWHWMLHHPVELLSFDSFHAGVEAPAVPLQVGTRFVIRHEFGLGYRQRRVARVNAARPYELGFSELAAEGDGIDWFPHSIHFRLVESARARCLVRLRVRGRFVFPLSRYWLMPAFEVLAPYRMERGLERLEQHMAPMLDTATGRRRAACGSGASESHEALPTQPSSWAPPGDLTGSSSAPV